MTAKELYAHFKKLTDAIYNDPNFKAQKITPEFLQLYKFTAEKLTKAIKIGLGIKGAIDYTTPDNEFITFLEQNIHLFAACKTYQELKQMSELLLDQNKKLRTFDDFKAEALKTFTTYNVQYLRAEFTHAVASARMAGAWQRHIANADTLPYLQYQTVGDDRVRQQHRSLHLITRPINDNFWDTHYPPNGWNCRCDTIALDDTAQITSLKGKELPTIPDIFKTNTAKSGLIFPKNHPYFKDVETLSKLENKTLGHLNFYQLVHTEPNGNIITAHPSQIVEAEYIQNLRIAKQISHLHKNIKLDRVINNETDQNGKPIKNPDYNIDGKIWELKQPESFKNGLLKRIGESRQQNAHGIVLEFTNYKDVFNLHEILKRIKGKFKDYVVKHGEEYNPIKTIYILKKDGEIIPITTKEILEY